VQGLVLEQLWRTLLSISKSSQLAKKVEVMIWQAFRSVCPLPPGAIMLPRMDSTLQGLAQRADHSRGRAPPARVVVLLPPGEAGINHDASSNLDSVHNMLVD
jgi:hypothetical protein